jgi:hypothetical protein
MTSNASDKPDQPVSQTVIDGVGSAIATLEAAIERAVEREVAFRAFVAAPGMKDVIQTAVDEAAGEARRVGVAALPVRVRQLTTSVLLAVYSEGIRPLPGTAIEALALARVVATNIVREGARLDVLAGSSEDNQRRANEWKALVAAASRSIESESHAAKDGIQEATLRALEAVLIAAPHHIELLDRAGGRADPEGYLYLEPLDEWFAVLVRRSVARAVNEARFSRGVHPLREDEDYPDEEPEGGIPVTPPDQPLDGNGGETVTPDPRRDREHRRDQDRIESLRELVATAEAMLPNKQRVSFLTKLFSPSKAEERRALILICREVVREIPHEIADDGELAVLVGSPTASTAQRNYSHARKALLDRARDEEQLAEWTIILDALLPRRSGSRAARMTS